MKIVDIDGDEAIVQTGGLKRKANISLVEDPRPGDYILMHAGFAIEKVKEKEAKKTLEALSQIE